MMNVDKNIFKHEKEYTIGVEEEFMICDPVNGELINKAKLFSK